MELLLMRHADAEDGGSGGDFSRVLTERGKRQANVMGTWLVSMEPGTIRILTSPLLRAHETASIVAGCLGKAATVQPDERLACGMTLDQGSAMMHDFWCADTLMLVGHAPDLGLYADHLLGARPGGVTFRKGALASFHADRPGMGGSTLRWFVHPGLMGH